MIPRLKNIPHFRRADEIIFQPDIGVEFQVPDPEGQVQSLIDLLDGRRGLDEVHASMQRRWPELSFDDVRDGIESLGEAGLVENAAAGSTMTEMQVERYSGNLAFLGGFATLGADRFSMQSRLLASRVLLLGVGGVGSPLLMNLAGLGVGHVTVVDHDSIELKNLNRQLLYREADVGRDKLDRAVEAARAFNSEIELLPVSGRIRSAEDVRQLLDGVDLVVSAIDEPPIVIHHWINDACVPAGVPFVTGGLLVRRAIYFSVSPGGSGCLRCLDQVQGAAAAEARELADGEHGNRNVMPATTLIAGLVGLEALRYLTGFAPPVAAGKVWAANLESGGLDVAYEWARQPDCPLCGDGAAEAAGETSRRVSV